MSNVIQLPVTYRAVRNEHGSKRYCDALSMLRALLAEGRYSDTLISPALQERLAQRFTASELSRIETPPKRPDDFLRCLEESIAKNAIVVK